MSETVVNLVGLDATKLLTSQEGEVPEAAMLVIADQFSQNVKDGCYHLTSLINQLDPVPELVVEKCEMVVDPNEKQYKTDYNTAILVLFYSGTSFRIIVVEFVADKPTLH
jgi:hypothetical protein